MRMRLFRICRRIVSVLFNEPKLLKSAASCPSADTAIVSVLFNEPKLLKSIARATVAASFKVSVLFNEPKLLKYTGAASHAHAQRVSVLFNEPKLLKFLRAAPPRRVGGSFSALQRAEIAEIEAAAAGVRAYREFQCSSTSRNC